MEELLSGMVTEVPAIAAIVLLVYFFLKHLRTLGEEQKSKDKTFYANLERITTNSEEFNRIREERYAEHAKELTTKYGGQMLRMVDELKEGRRQGEDLVKAVIQMKTGG